MALDSQAKIEWALVIFFYAAVHYVEAYLADVGQHLRSHTTRDAFVGRDTYLRRIFSEYQDLKYYGYSARYEMSVFAASDVAIAAAHFTAVKTHITSAL